jgi:hypothetical protein
MTSDEPAQAARVAAADRRAGNAASAGVAAPKMVRQRCRTMWRHPLVALTPADLECRCRRRRAWSPRLLRERRRRPRPRHRPTGSSFQTAVHAPEKKPLCPLARHRGPRSARLVGLRRPKDGEPGEGGVAPRHTAPPSPVSSGCERLCSKSVGSAYGASPRVSDAFSASLNRHDRSREAGRRDLSASTARAAR